jgi:hypothetical protein
MSVFLTELANIAVSITARQGDLGMLGVVAIVASPVASGA